MEKVKIRIEAPSKIEALEKNKRLFEFAVEQSNQFTDAIPYPFSRDIENALSNVNQIIRNSK